jgi:hypothetical protein
MRHVGHNVRRDREPALAAIGGVIEAIRAAGAPAIGQVGKGDVIIAKISAADRRIWKLRPNGRLGMQTHCRQNDC